MEYVSPTIKWVYFTDPRSPWERRSNENTNGLIREDLPQGIDLSNHQPYLNAIADELNDRPRATLGYLSPRDEIRHAYMTRLLIEKAAVYGAVQESLRGIFPQRA